MKAMLIVSLLDAITHSGLPKPFLCILLTLGKPTKSGHEFPSLVASSNWLFQPSIHVRYFRFRARSLAPPLRHANAKEGT